MIRHTLERHAGQIALLEREALRPEMAGTKYVLVVVDGPESFNREASWSSSFNDQDTHKIFQALADQTRAS